MECYEDLGEFDKALTVCEHLMTLPENSTYDFWLKKGILARKVADYVVSESADLVVD